MSSPTLTFLGAVDSVTGSRFLVEAGERRLLVDAGLYQGERGLRRRNWDPPAFDPAAIAAVVLTHAHLDHCGYLPRLVREGFTGDVLCSQGTAELAAIILRDSAHLQEEDARNANEQGWSRHHPALPLYDSGDVEQTLAQFRAVPFGARVAVRTGLDVTFRPAGHILGSATARVEVDGSVVVFSGDLGRSDHPLLEPPAPPGAAGTLVVESTYGDRLHPPRDRELLASVIRRTAARGGSVLIPAFAVDRTELVLLELRRLMVDSQIPKMPVFVDSPMALAALDVYRRAMREMTSPEIRRSGAEALDALADIDVREVREVSESERLNRPAYPSIIISASGMATGGRVVHHLAHQLPDPRNSVVLTGFQAVGTRGRQLSTGATHLKMHGRYVPVRAEVVQVPTFSVHADADGLVAWVDQVRPRPRTVYVVHGEPDASQALAGRIERELSICAVAPRLGERVRLD